MSRVLNGHPGVSATARDRVMAAANDQRYLASDGPRKTTNLALVSMGGIPMVDLLHSPYEIGVLRGMARAAEDNDFNLMILDCGRNKRPDETHSQMFHRKGVRGAVLHGLASNHAVCKAVADEGFPAVVVAERIDHPGLSWVCGDSAPSSRDAVDHLVALGHRRIGVCVNWHDDSDHTDRLQAWRASLSAAGLDSSADLVFRLPAMRDSGVQLLRRWRSLPDPPTAFFIADPMTAVGMLHEAIAQKVRIPEELSVVGFDDGSVRFDTSPVMSAVCQDAETCGHRAALLLLECIDAQPGHRRQERIPTRFEVHGSTAAIPPSRLTAASS